LFVSEIIPINNSPLPYSELGILLTCSVIFSVLINYYRNIYWFSISLFTMLWLPLLAFGINSKTMVNILFASQYNYWEGFFELSKVFTPYSLSAYFAGAMIITIMLFVFRPRANKQY
jgi:peptidoglycan biosynthesis protein MviN/MurJ (putative lipid II flippase)